MNLRWALPVLLMACGGSDPGFLSVDLRTDFLPAIEVAEVEVGVFNVSDSSGPSMLRATLVSGCAHDRDRRDHPRLSADDMF